MKVQYAVTEDGTHVAYVVLDADPACRDPHDLVLVPGGVVPLEIFEDDPGFARMLDGLRGLGRLVVFDRRGIGFSDPIVDWERPVLDQWADDLAAVVDAADLHDVVVVATEGYGIGSRYAALHPERVGHLVLYDPIVSTDDEWIEFSAARLAEVQANIRGEWDSLDLMAPSRAGDPSFREWYEQAGRAGASPASAARLWQSVIDTPPSGHLLDRITAPTLLLHRRDSIVAPPGNVQFAATQLADSTIVELDGADGFAFVGDVDTLLAEIAEFVVGERRLPPPTRLLAAVLFSDLVGSTQRAATLGDAQWKSLLNRHDTAVRSTVGGCGGSVVKTTGDGVLALFPSASAALESARRFRARLALDDLEVRVGIHVGDIDRRGDDVSGLAVNIAARVMAKAPDGGVAVTSSVITAMAGQAARFEPMGSYELKGIPGEWELARVVD